MNGEYGETNPDKEKILNEVAKRFQNMGCIALAYGCILFLLKVSLGYRLIIAEGIDVSVFTMIALILGPALYIIIAVRQLMCADKLRKRNDYSYSIIMKTGRVYTALLFVLSLQNIGIGIVMGLFFIPSLGIALLYYIYLFRFITSHKAENLL